MFDHFLASTCFNLYFGLKLHVMYLLVTWMRLVKGKFHFFYSPCNKKREKWPELLFLFLVHYEARSTQQGTFSMQFSFFVFHDWLMGIAREAAARNVARKMWVMPIYHLLCIVCGLVNLFRVLLPCCCSPFLSFSMHNCHPLHQLLLQV